MALRERQYPVLIIHGFTTHKLSNLPLHRALRKEHFQTHNVNIPGLNTQDIRRSSELVEERVEEIKKRMGVDKVQLVGVSMGGLIGLHYIRQRGGHSSVNKFVTLGTPFQGAQLAKIFDLIPIDQEIAAKQLAPDSEFMQEILNGDFEPCDITSIGAKGDTLVPEPLFHLDGAENILSPHGTWPVGHYDLVLKKGNQKILIDVLQVTNSFID